MTDSIKEKILKNIKTTLEGITTSKGYDTTVASVQRFQVAGQDKALTPYIIITQGEDNILKEGPNPKVSRRLSIDLEIGIRQDPAEDTRPSDELMNVLEGDISRALQMNPGRGGNANDTSSIESSPLFVEDGMPDLGKFIFFDVDYQHIRNNPKSL